MKKPELTIAICSYNRKNLLKKALDSLLPQLHRHTSTELIIVDNNSTDGTLEFLDNYRAEHQKLDIKNVQETQQGLSHARNRAYKEAKGQYVAYMDDDAIAPDNWVAKCLCIIQEKTPDIFGGPIYPYYLTEKPHWFKDTYEIREHVGATRWLKKGEYISGSNMVIRKIWLQKLNGFDTKLGMNAGTIAYGEETDFIIKAHKKSAKIYYDLSLKMLHYVPPYKMTLPYFVEQKAKQAKLLPQKQNYGTDKRMYDPVEQLYLIHEQIAGFLEIAENISQDTHGRPENNFIEKLLPQLIPIIQLHKEFLTNQGKNKNIFSKLSEASIARLTNKIKSKINI